MVEGKPVVCTIFCKNYLAQTRSFYASLRRCNPTLRFLALMVDRPDGLFDPASEPFEILNPDAFGDADLPALLFQNDLQSACCLMKPRLLRHLLNQGLGPVLFMDPDILVLHDLDPAIAAIDAAGVALTPHFLSPPPEPDRIRRELSLLRGGTYNGGFVGVSPRREAFEFLDWWSDRMRAFCGHDPAAGVHYDQRWLDLAPSLFDGVKALRDPGLNVAYWNFAERAARVEEGGVSVGRQPCRFFHFSGYDPAAPDRFTRFDDFALQPVSLSPVAPLFARYREALLSTGWEAAHDWPYSHTRFSNGAAIAPLLREIHAPDAMVFADPFDAADPNGFYRSLCATPEGRAPRLWREVYDRRPDLRAKFADIDGADREAFGVWFAQRMPLEFGLDARMIKDCRAA
jgi:hypothetical protein